MPYALGEEVTLTFTAPADATVELHVTAPDGTESEPVVSNVSTTWSGTVEVDQLGVWLFAWIATGTGDNVELGTLQVGVPWYTTLTAVKNALTISSNVTATDDDYREGIATSARSIDSHCNRRFYADTTATARLFYAEPDRDNRIDVSDFWTTDDLAIATDEDGDGVFETTWATADYELQPLNGIVDGEEGWPYYRIKAVRRSWPSQRDRASVQLTAKWGWAAFPAPIISSNKILASEVTKLTREAPFGVADFGQSGLIRLRENDRVLKLLAKYRRHPVVMA